MHYSSTDFVVADITVTGERSQNFDARWTDYTDEFTPSGLSESDTTLKFAKEKFNNTILAMLLPRSLIGHMIQILVLQSLVSFLIKFTLMAI